MEESQFTAFIALLSNTDKKIPIDHHRQNWITMADKMTQLYPDLIQRYTFENLRDNLKRIEHGEYPTISKLEESLGWNGSPSLLLVFLS